MYQFPVKGIVSPLVILHVVPDAPTGLLHTILSMVGNPPDVGMVVGLLGSQLLHTPLPEDPTQAPLLRDIALQLRKELLEFPLSSAKEADDSFAKC